MLWCTVSVFVVTFAFRMITPSSFPPGVTKRYPITDHAWDCFWRRSICIRKISSGYNPSFVMLLSHIVKNGFTWFWQTSILFSWVSVTVLSATSCLRRLLWSYTVGQKWSIRLCLLSLLVVGASCSTKPVKVGRIAALATCFSSHAVIALSCWFVPTLPLVSYCLFCVPLLPCDCHPLQAGNQTHK